MLLAFQCHGDQRPQAIFGNLNWLWHWSPLGQWPCPFWEICHWHLPNQYIMQLWILLCAALFVHVNWWCADGVFMPVALLASLSCHCVWLETHLASGFYLCWNQPLILSCLLRASFTRRMCILPSLQKGFQNWLASLQVCVFIHPRGRRPWHHIIIQVWWEHRWLTSPIHVCKSLPQCGQTCSMLSGRSHAAVALHAAFFIIAWLVHWLS